MDVGSVPGETPDSGAVAARFTARHDEIVNRYQERLTYIGSPLVGSQRAWTRCRAQASDVLLSCARTLRDGAHVDVDVDLGNDRELLGIHVCHWVKAGALLFSVAVPVLMEEVNRERGCLPMLGPTLDSLQSAIGQRVSAGAEGYDALLLSQLRAVHGESHRKLARALHDEVGNGLSLAMRQLELLEISPEHGESECCFRITSAKAALVESMGRIRDVITDLRKPANTESLETGLLAYARSMATPGIATSVTVTGDECGAPPRLLDELFIVLRECLRNAFTHAGPDNVDVDVVIRPGQVRATVTDDGIGFDTDRVASSKATNGLLSMGERVLSMGGRFVVRSVPDAGTTIAIALPVPEVVTGDGR